MCNVPPKFYQLCRLCLSLPESTGDASLSVFDKDSSSLTISTKIMTCLSIMVTDTDPLPHIVCMKCSDQLHAFYCFKEMADRTQVIFNRFLTETKQLIGTPQAKKERSTALLEEMVSTKHLEPVKFEFDPHDTVIKREPMECDAAPKIKVKSEALLRSSCEGNTNMDTDAPMALVNHSQRTESILPPYSSSPRFEQNVPPPAPSPTEPADLSNRKPENVTCVPEIDFIKDDVEVGSEYSNSSDPERLEVDMSQGMDDHSNSTTTSAPSPTSDAHQPSENHPPDLWQALSQNGHSSAPLSGEASHLLRKLITCRKLGMTITPAPPFMGDSYDQAGKEAKTSGRRKQSFPTKMEPEDSSSPSRDPETESEYIPDFTGSSSWCNLQIVKNAKGAGMARRVDLACTNCGTQTTTIWRRNMKGEMVCNACGLYYKLHGVDRPHTMRRDTIHTRRRRPKGSDERSERRSIAPKKVGNNNTNDITDTEDMLSALRRQLQPHLVRALTGQKNLVPQMQAVNYPNIVINQSSSQPSADMESEDESYRDLPLNLVATQMAETETH